MGSARGLIELSKVATFLSAFGYNLYPKCCIHKGIATRMCNDLLGLGVSYSSLLSRMYVGEYFHIVECDSTPLCVRLHVLSLVLSKCYIWTLLSQVRFVRPL